ncbi:MAG: hypothetical protein P4M08_05100 [Oligoflexia bacterium]|nr:hypothetical protein [Oligoflexia bacterium]
MITTLLTGLASAHSVWASESDFDVSSCPDQVSITFVDLKPLSSDEVNGNTFRAAALVSEPARNQLGKLKSLSFQGALGGDFDGTCHYFTAENPNFPMGEITTRWGHPTLHVTIFAEKFPYDVFVELDSGSDGIFEITSGTPASITHQPGLDGVVRNPYVKIGTAVVE